MRRPAALLLLHALLSGCTRWELHDSPPEHVLASEGGESVRLTLSDGRRVVLHGAYVERDSVIGFALTDRRGERRALPLDEVTQIATSRARDSRALTAVALGVLVGVGGALLVVGAAR